MNPRIVALHTYPIKGCAGIALTDTLVTPAGIAHDRTFLIVDEHGVFRSQRRDPKLATIRPEVVDDGRELMLHAPGTDALRIAVVLDGPRRPVEMFGVPYRGIDQGDAVAEWLSHVLGSRSSLVRVPPEHDRVTDGETPGTAGYADSGALLLTSHASWVELDRRIAGRGAEPGGWNPAELAEAAGRVNTGGWKPPEHAEAAGRVNTGGWSGSARTSWWTGGSSRTSRTRSGRPPSATQSWASPSSQYAAR
jgi:uncharacterized protein